jgi:gamma-glutamylcyclotransferase (GGCT)/AIG2-like uncharacterized protein YtfP
VAAGPLPLFAYGTLADPQTRQRLLGARPELEVVRARLRGYARVSVPGFSYPFIVPSEPDAVVDGVLILGLSAADYDVLDEYEEVAAGTYVRVRTEVEILGCGAPRTVRAWVYAQAPSFIARSRSD